MTAPKDDRAGIRQALRALKKGGCTPTYVEYGGGEGEELTPETPEREVIDAIMEVDDAYLIVELPARAPDETHPGHTPEGRTSHVRFVMGNDPDEVICDYGLSLSEWLDPLIDRWIA